MRKPQGRRSQRVPTGGGSSWPNEPAATRARGRAIDNGWAGLMKSAVVAPPGRGRTDAPGATVPIIAPFDENRFAATAFRGYRNHFAASGETF